MLQTRPINQRQAAAVGPDRLTRRQLLRRAGPLALGAAALPVLQACAGGGAQPTAKPVTTAAPVKPAASPAASPGAAAGPVVQMNDELKFVPDRLTVKVGDTVTWRNAGTVAHTVTDDPAKAQNKANATLPSGAEPWDSGLVAGGQTWSRTFGTAGDYRYFCVPHESAGMLGTLTVTA